MSEPGGIVQTDPSSTSRRHSVSEDKTNVKETIESILVAFILAFIFRAFVVEAFVIPTGSMAPTLLGAHMRFRCPDCGWTFDVNYSSDSDQDSDDMRMPSDAAPTADIYCPNCGRLVASAPPPRLFEAPKPQSLVPVNFGDRILVLKYIYLLHPPQRWDVVVFKTPDDPNRYHYDTNFIKRLVGLPGERLMVLDGNLYRWDTTEGKWEIPDKPRSAQESLWRLVYDNDYYPQGGHRLVGPQFVQPWRDYGGSGWDTSHGRVFQFNNTEGVGTLRFDPNANSTSQTLTDYLAYDAYDAYHHSNLLRRPGVIGSDDDINAYPVSDLKLMAYYTRQSGSGALRLDLSRFVDVDHTFTAEITPKVARLIHRTNTGEVSSEEVPLAKLGIGANDPIHIEFANVDYRVSLRLNGKDAFPQPMKYEPNVPWLIQQYRDGRRNSRPGEARIEAENQKCALDHVSLWRDVYYTNRGPNLHATPNSPVQLGKGEYFVMGDNSEISEDARYWNMPIVLPHEGLDIAEGRVPEQFLLGKAVFVYWPAGFRVWDGFPFSIIPNFGDMRWIH
jgi:signal peptidase I